MRDSMRERSLQQLFWYKYGAFWTVSALLLFWISGGSRLTAQEHIRQLERPAAERRLALVIGNGTYASTPRLRNPASDASLLATTLRKLGFEVMSGTDKSQREMKQLIREFGTKLRSERSIGLFYFAGHGVQAKGRNYLIPVDADIQSEADLEDVAVDLNYILNTMDEAQNALNIVILDACRNNPYARSYRSAQEGLAQVKAPTGTLIAYATAPDSVAADGSGPNSPYAEELTKQMQLSGVLLETTFRRVTEQVSSRTGGKQEPWYSANVKGDFYFVGGTPLSANATSPASSIPPFSSASSAVADSSKPKNTGPPKQVVWPYSIELESCLMPDEVSTSGLDVVCDLKITNKSPTTREFTLSHNDYRLRRRGKDATKATTNDGNQYELSESVIGSNKARNALFNKAVLPPDVPVNMTLTFKSVRVSSTSFVLLRLAIYQESSNNPSLMQYADFKNVGIER